MNPDGLSSDSEDAHGHDDHAQSPILVATQIATVAFCAVAVWFEFPDANPPILVIGSQIYLPFSFYGVFGLAFGGWPIFKEAIESVVERKMTMELSMSIAIWAGAYSGSFFASLIITFFVLVAEVLEGLTVERGRRAIRALLELLPKEVSVRRGDAIKDVRAEDIVVGDTILVAPGERIPVDGEVIGGHSFVDESQITGESLPAEKMAGASALAGTINQSGALEIRAERLGRDTSYGKIIEAVEHAEKSRAPVQRLADRFAGYIVYAAIAFAFLEYYMSRDLTRAISVIIVAGACGVAAGTPLAILGGIGRAARLGAIVKGGIHLETLGRVDTVVLDKTGTLTFGMPEVQKIVPVAGISSEAVLAAAVTAELRSEHPFGKAIIRYAGALARQSREPERFDYVPGRGITAVDGDAILLVGNEAWMLQNKIALPVGLGGWGKIHPKSLSRETAVFSVLSKS